MADDQDYPWIRKWGRYMGSYQYYIDAQVQKARETNAPDNAIYHRDDGPAETNGWHTVDDITNEMTKHHLGLSSSSGS